MRWKKVVSLCTALWYTIRLAPSILPSSPVAHADNAISLILWRYEEALCTVYLLQTMRIWCSRQMKAQYYYQHYYYYFAILLVGLPLELLNSWSFEFKTSVSIVHKNAWLVSILSTSYTVLLIKSLQRWDFRVFHIILCNIWELYVNSKENRRTVPRFKV